MAAERHAGVDTGTTNVLDQLQASLNLDDDAATRWMAAARTERHASARRREDRLG